MPCARSASSGNRSPAALRNEAASAARSRNPIRSKISRGSSAAPSMCSFWMGTVTSGSPPRLMRIAAPVPQAAEKRPLADIGCFTGLGERISIGADPWSAHWPARLRPSGHRCSAPPAPTPAPFERVAVNVHSSIFQVAEGFRDYVGGAFGDFQVPEFLLRNHATRLASSAAQSMPPTGGKDNPSARSDIQRAGFDREEALEDFDQADDLHLKAGLLAHLADPGIFQKLARFDCAPRQRPPPFSGSRPRSTSRMRRPSIMSAPTPSTGLSGYWRLILQRSLHARAHSIDARAGGDEQRFQIPAAKGAVRRVLRLHQCALQLTLRRVNGDTFRSHVEAAVHIDANTSRHARYIFDQVALVRGLPARSRSKATTACRSESVT